jgi:hypothetical protein
MADADKPVARLQIDTRAYGPLVCEHCEEHDPDYAEAETALLMEDGGVVCEECHTPFKAFEQFSGVVTSVEPVKVRRSTGARGVDKGFEIVEE